MGNVEGTYRADELVQHAHALIPHGGDALLDADRAPRDEVVQRPAQDDDEEPCEGGPAEKSNKEYSFRLGERRRGNDLLTGTRRYLR